MAFWSKLGKGLLKVGKVAAPIALGMTGVGLPAAMAVSGGLNALDKKVSGGSWKDALKSGAIGAGTAAAGAGMGKLGGWAGKFANKGGIPSMPAVQSGLPAGMENVGRVAGYGGGRSMAPSMSAFQRIMGNIGQGARTAQDVMGAVGAARGAMGGGGYGRYGTPPFNPGQSGIMGGMGGPYGRMGGRGRAMPRMNQRAPNLAYAIQQGRQEAMMNQPWRTAPFNPNAQYPIYPNMGGVSPSPEMMQQFAQ